MAVFALLISTAMTFPGEATASDGFQGYPPAVRAQAERVVAAASAEKTHVFETEVRTLRIRMHETGILSMNAIPDLLFDKAARGGWKERASPILRIAREVSPFSVPMWAWLVKEDLAGGDLPGLFEDVEGLAGALRRFSPALLGYGAWLLSFLFAAGCWFAIWGSVALFLRARPSLEGDVQRFLKFRQAEYLAPVAVALIFVLPLAAGLGPAPAACIWLLLSVAYLRRGELAIMTAVILALAGLLLCGGVLHSIKMFADGSAGEWMGSEGILVPESKTGGVEERIRYSDADIFWMESFGRARRDMQTGNSASAEKRWTALLQRGRDLPEVLNNRGIARALQGKEKEALADFEAAVDKRRGDPPALWNTYQTHLRMFNLNRARLIQQDAWERLREMRPFMFRPADMEQGEWIASPMPAPGIWRAVFRLREDWVRDAGESDMFASFFRPLSAPMAVAFLAAVWLSSSAWNLLSRKLWVHHTCRSCGARSLAVRSRESSEMCAPCRVKLGTGVKMGIERTRRIQSINMHRRYVRAASLAVPGVGVLWSGKEIQALVYGVILSLALGAVTCSLGGGRAGSPLIAELQKTVSVWAVALTATLWIFGAAWGIRAFTGLQRAHNVAGERE